MVRKADISPCGRYRYTLLRIWEAEKPLVAFVGVNPSTADDKQDDPTIRRLIEFAKSWGYGGFVIVNLFALRSPRPQELLLDKEPIGADNDMHIDEAVRLANKLVFCWGNWGAIKGRNEQIAKRYPQAECFGLTKDGHPKHPLYLHHTAKLEPYKMK